MDTPPLELIASRILCLRNQRVMVDADLARLYGVTTKALNQAAKRNSQRFPPDFMFQLTADEKHEVVTNCDHLNSLKFSKALPFAFTEHGAIQAANVLNSGEAVAMGVLVVRAFVRLRNLVASHKELGQRLDELEQQMDYRFGLQDETIEQIMAALRQMMASPETPRRPIGFIHPKADEP